MQVDRRSLIAAIPAAAVVAAVPASAMALPADRREWEHAMARLSAVRAENKAFDENVLYPAMEREEAFEKAHGVVHRLPNGEWATGYFEKRRALEAEFGTAHRVPEHLHDRSDALGVAWSNAEQAVMDTSAPDLAALRWKLDHVIEVKPDDGDDGATPCWSISYVRQMLLDIERLLPPAA